MGCGLKFGFVFSAPLKGAPEVDVEEEEEEEEEVWEKCGLCCWFGWGGSLPPCA